MKGARVLVAGGGLAGLTAARDLIDRGAEVHVIEARNCARSARTGAAVQGPTPGLELLQADARERDTTAFSGAGDGVFGVDFKLNAIGVVAIVRPHAFAGDHTSREWQGYMNGAVESGQRAARDIETMRLMESISASPA